MICGVQPSHQTVRLAQGRHHSPQLGACVMELASMLAGESFSDRPATVSPVIAAFLRTYNDGIDDDRRQDLYPLAALIVGTSRGRAAERERVSRCLEFARELGASTPPGRGAIAIATAEASGSWAALAALRDGSGESHSRALSLVRELVAVQSLAPSRLRPRWLFGRDPAQAVAEVLDSAPLRSATGDAPNGTHLERERPACR
jgi:hypothetical protein